MKGKSPDEWVDLVDEQNQIIGREKRAVVRRDNLLHRGIALLVFNSKGQIYVHQRTADKDLFPCLYDMFVGGVVGEGESYDTAVRREALEELGVKADAPEFMFDYLYHGPENYAWIRCYRTVWDGPVRHQPEEIQWGEWLDAKLLDRWVKQVEIVPDGLEVFRHWRSLEKTA